jgi:hypothetical protein
MIVETPHPMTREEVANYRASVDALIAECLVRIRSYPIARDADPVPERARS